MMSNPQQEAEARKVYDLYWDSYLHGETEVFASTLDDAFEMIGTSESELCHSKADGIAFLENQTQELAGKVEMRHRRIKIVPVDDQILINEHADIYTLTNETWQFYSKLRLSTLLHYTRTGWKIMQQHASLPDARVEEGETLALEKVSKENLELRDAIKRRTFELENKNRELEIESSLERVRTVAMALRKPDDMLEVCHMITEQLEILGIKEIRNVQTAIIDGHGKSTYMNYQYFKQYKEGSIEEVEIEEHPAVKAMIQRMQESPDAFHSHTFKGRELAEWRQYRKEDNQFPDPILENAEALYFYFYSIGEGGLGLSAYIPLSEEDIIVFHRFRNVFSLAYQRFRDIEQAETQALEARIQLALERVRSSTMAMHHTGELKEVISVTFEQIKSLDIILDSCIITLFIEGSDDLDNWVASAEQKYPQKIRVPYFKHPLFDKIALAKKKPGNYFTVKLSQKENQVFYTHVFENSDFGKIIKEDRRNLVMNAESNIMSFANFQHSGLRVGNFHNHTYTPEENKTILRFANVFEQTYTRFLDLQKAEEQTREALIESGLERVRSRTMAMQSCEELSETAAVVFHELFKLGVSPNRLYIAIIDPEEQEINFYLTDEEGGQDCSLYTANIQDNISMRKMYDGWAEKRTSITIDMHGPELESYFQYLTEVLHIPIRNAHAPTRRIHKIAYFSQGYIGIASLDDQPEETTKLLERFAAVFNLTYTRFNDLKQAEYLAEQAELDLIKLKEEKARTEIALTELKAAQAQLIQSEKMASLGELTAGIAHEIQNPLNFVNNFSEVSNELVDEMKEELAIGNPQHAMEIADDVKQNLEKILHHGKRADAIVKGMLQHSRTSSGVKEPTDINALADEYLRLAYHGLRAKDKNFNAELKTDFDPSIGLINVVPQDIGRVFLNLINNAFQAVSGPQPSAPKSPKGDFTTLDGVRIPSVLVQTRTLSPLQGVGGRTVEISISDNGPGIPDSIKDKIFQPFFTTKPTGQGTGLGLSLSYDIVKAHGGEISVKSVEGEGTVFIIELPID